MTLTTAQKETLESLFDDYITKIEDCGDSEAAWSRVERYADSLRNAGVEGVTRFVDMLDECEEDRIAEEECDDFPMSLEYEDASDHYCEQFDDLGGAYA